MNILIIEDDSSVLSLVERLLTAKGHKVLTAHDPNDASVVLAQHDQVPDLLLTDIHSFPTRRSSDRKSVV